MTLGMLDLLTLAVDDGVTTLTSREFDWPQTTWGGLLLLVGTVAVVAWVAWLYRRETRQLSLGWRIWLTVLRLAVLAVLLLIALNPSDRTQKQSFRPSRVAVLIDTSLSMRHPASGPATQNQSEKGSDPLKAGLGTEIRLETMPSPR